MSYMRVDNGEGGVVNLLTRQGSWEPDKQDAVFSIVMSSFHYVVTMNLI